MKLTDYIKNKKDVLSLEILPPNRGKKLSNLFSTIESLLKYNPKFINVTNHQNYFKLVEEDGKIEKIPLNLKTGTLGVSAAIHYKFNIETVPHIICGGINKFELEDLLIDLNYLDLKNLFVARGDPIPNQRFFKKKKDGFQYASEIIKQISEMNKGEYLCNLKQQTSSNFCTGVAGYPEKHYEALNLKEDLKNLKLKVDMGADYIITQMFFDIQKFKNFVKEARKIGITVPIIPGIKPIVREKFLRLIPRVFYIDSPNELVKGFAEARTRKEEFDFGTKYITNLIEELLDYGVPGIHLFTMGKGKSTSALLNNLKGSFK